MAWNEYVSRLKEQGLSDAAICGLDASWLHVDDKSKISMEELSALVHSMGSVDTLASEGIKLAGQKYMYLSGTDSVCRGKKGPGGLHAAKSKTTLVVGVYNERLQPQQAANAVEAMAEYLVQQNF